ncbi:MAG: signal peptide peptidase SppA [Spirochaetales bacterium]|nr:signal peptide peptidase SppA [Spirochaetales bacterium]
MKKTLLIAVLLLSILLSAGAQDFGIAVQDQISSVLTNPAAMGVGNSQGIGYINRFTTDRGFEKDFDLIFSLGNLAYSYGNSYGTHKNLIAAGFDLGLGIYTGGGYQWYSGTSDAGGLELSLLYRPVNFLSFAVRGRDLTTNGYMEMGFGLRPFFFSDLLRTRLTLSGDARVQDGEFQGVSLGAFMEPADGIKIFGDYNFENEVFQVGLSLSFSYLELGTAFDVSGDRSWNDGTFSAAIPVKKQRSFVEHSFNKAVEYDLADVILDTPARGYNPFQPRSGQRTIVDFVLDMEKIKQDSTTDVLIFRNQRFATSFANLLEIEKVLKEVKASGKEIYFYYDSIDNLPYALAASVADRIFLSPAGTVYLRGFGTTNFYLREFFEKWGIRVNNFRSHDYKTAYNSFSESGMTDAEREALQYVYDSLQAQMNRMIESGRRGKLNAPAQELIDSGPFIYASKALASGLVDGLLYEDEFDNRLHEMRLTVFRASRSTGEIVYDWEETARPVIALIYAEGGIYDGEGMAGSSIGADSMVRAIRAARSNPLVKGIIFRVNSGGGSVLASDRIAREIALCSSGDNPKPVIVSMGGSAASGGYYISAPATRIIASPATITGSIGVVTIMPEISGLMEKLGIAVESVKAAEHTDTFNPLTPLSSEEEEMIREYITENYEKFIALVGEYRQMPEARVHEYAQGRIWTGEQALERGLVDATGGITDAYRLMQQLIKTDKTVRLLEMVPGRVPNLFIRSLEQPLQKASSDLPLPEDIQNLMKMYANLSSYREGEALYLMPYSEEELGTAAE